MNRRRLIAIMVAGASAVLMPYVVAPPRLVVWNASASLPIGFYLLRSPGNIRPGDIVAIAPPAPLAAMLDARGALPAGVPLLKRVAAIGGQIVCRAGFRILIDGQPAGVALPHDGKGRPLPDWQGCRRLGNALFLLNPAPDSFDSRYFGPLPHSAVIGRAIPLWSFLSWPFSDSSSARITASSAVSSRSPSTPNSP